MTNRPSATPYAKALFDVAVSEDKVESIGQELQTLTKELVGQDDVMKLLTHPAVPPRAKREAMAQYLAEASVAPPIRKLLTLMADRDRLGLLAALNDGYQARLREHQGILEAHVTTAVPLSGERTSALTLSLERATGRRIRVTTAVDPAILGGVIARMGSKVFDGSVARQLERLRERLVSSDV